MFGASSPGFIVDDRYRRLPSGASRREHRLGRPFRFVDITFCLVVAMGFVQAVGRAVFLVDIERSHARLRLSV